MERGPQQASSHGEIVENAETEMSREAAERLLETWPKPGGTSFANPFLPKIQLQLRGEWKQTAPRIFLYQFKVSARRFFFGDSVSVSLESLTLHWMFDPGNGPVKVGKRTMKDVMEVEKASTFDQELYRALAWGEGSKKNKHYRTFLAVLA